MPKGGSPTVTKESVEDMIGLIRENRLCTGPGKLDPGRGVLSCYWYTVVVFCSS